MMVNTGFPAEMTTKRIEIFMTQYVIDPEAKVLRHPKYYFEIGEIKINHKGLKKPLGRRLWVGPNVSATIKESSMVPWENMAPQCSNYIEFGHILYTCTRPQKCRNCRKEGHQAKNCTKCPRCTKWGQDDEVCFFNPKNA